MSSASTVPDPPTESRSPSSRRHGITAGRLRAVLCALLVGGLIATALSGVRIETDENGSRHLIVTAREPILTAAERAFFDSAPGDCLVWSSGTDTDAASTSSAATPTSPAEAAQDPAVPTQELDVPTAAPPTGQDNGAVQPGGTAPAHSMVDLTNVPCENLHNFEIAAVFDLNQLFPGKFTDNTAFPSADTMSAIQEENCRPLVNQFTGGRFDPYGRFSVELIWPSLPAWNRGDRQVRCGVSATDNAGQPQATAGRITGAEQERLWDPGTCIELATDAISEVPCTRTHHVEIIGYADVSQRFQVFPTPEELQEFYTEICSSLAVDYLGGAEALRNSTLVGFPVGELQRESWDAGSRRTPCGVAHLNEEDRPSLLAGSVKGTFTIDGAPPKSPPPLPPLPAEAGQTGQAGQETTSGETTGPSPAPGQTGGN